MQFSWIRWSRYGRDHCGLFQLEKEIFYAGTNLINYLGKQSWCKFTFQLLETKTTTVMANTMSQWSVEAGKCSRQSSFKTYMSSLNGMVNESVRYRYQRMFHVSICLKLSRRWCDMHHWTDSLGDHEFAILPACRRTSESASLDGCRGTYSWCGNPLSLLPTFMDCWSNFVSFDSASLLQNISKHLIIEYVERGAFLLKKFVHMQYGFTP